ncbi:MAG TPA: beta-propeller fold lactonase family protein, partial [Verrucomicrobiae bacterium]|nr:beta-propeller fold lactonase family protein [Verrucomicrobiae bacterium]
MRTIFCLLTMAGLLVTNTRADLTNDSPGQPTIERGILPGKQPDGSVLLPNMWSLRPVGEQVELGDDPVNVAVHPDGQFAAVLHSGESQHEVIIVDIRQQKVISRTPLHETFYGIQFSKNGNLLFCSGAGDETIHVFKFLNGLLSDDHELKLRDPKERGVPAGLAVDQKGQRLFAANVLGPGVTRIDLGNSPKISDILLASNDFETMPEAKSSSTNFDTAAAQKRTEAAHYKMSPDAPFPYTCLLDEKHNRLYVTLWAQAAVAVVDLNSNQVIARWPTQAHPCEMALTKSGKFLFVANANQNTVTVLDTTTGKSIENIWAALYPDSPPGSTPNSLALSPNGKLLFIANANINVVAVFDVSTPGKSRSLGFIPVGWYPTSVRVTPDGKTLLVANRKGVMPRSNPHGPVPGIHGDSEPTVEYIGRLFRGTLSIIDLKNLEQKMPAWTTDAYRCSPLNAEATVTAHQPANNPIPQQPGGVSPIKYCLYIIKENRTYDQVLGDLPQGNGDSNLCLFPEAITPNHHALARQFVLLDNFYAEAEISAQGHEWSMGAYSSDFVEKLWPMDYGHNKSNKFPYPAEGDFQIAFPAGGYLWDRAQAAGVTYRSYGEFINNGETTLDPMYTSVKALKGHFDEWYRGFDLNYPDALRADRFIDDLKDYEVSGEMPRLQIIRLPSDHTHGSTKGFPTPTSYVRDNDLALGRVVDAVSHSRFWPQTAIFIVEDDAQNGPDHVDAHRTIAFVASPYTKHAAVDSTM